MEKRLTRSRTNRMIWGGGGGLGKYLSVDPTIIRILFVVSLFIGSLGFWVYIIMALVVPLEGKV